MIKGQQVFYEGRVQGVGFRYTVRQIAKEFDVTGWVRNLDDGRVELLVCGAPEEVDAFLETISQSELHSFIKGVDKKTPPPEALSDLRGFEIRS